MTKLRKNIVLNVAGNPTAHPCSILREMLEVSQETRMSVLCQIYRPEEKRQYVFRVDPDEDLATACKNNGAEYKPDDRPDDPEGALRGDTEEGTDEGGPSIRGMHDGEE